MVDILPHEKQATSSPDTTFRPNVSAATFGGQVAQATESFGTAVANVGHHWGEIVANEQVNNYQEEVDKLIRGDPTKTVTMPDGTTEPDLGYMATRGRAALDQRPLYAKKLEDLTKQYEGRLFSADQKNLFNTASRRYRAITMGEMGRHADAQGVIYATGTTDAQAKNSLRTIASTPDDPERVAHAASDLIDARVKKAMILGAQPGDPQWTAARDQGRQEAIAAQALAIAAGDDPMKAKRIIENNREALGLQYDNLMDHVRARADQQYGRQTADGMLSGTSPNENNIGNVRPRGSSTGFVQVKSFDEGVGLAVQNARAYPAAFNGGKDMSLQQIGAKWAPVGDGANDPNQWAKNVAAGGGLPVDKPIDLNDPDTAAKFARGVHVAEWGGKKARPLEDYKKAITGGGTGGASVAETPRTQADLIAEIESRNLPPQARAAAVARINEAYRRENALEVKRKAEFKQKVDDSTAEALYTGVTSNPLPENDFLRHYGPEEGRVRFNEYQSTLTYSADRQSLDTMSDVEQAQFLNSRMPQPGAPGYAMAMQQQGKLEKAAQEIQKQRRDDPSAAVAKNAAVQAAIGQYDEKNPETFKAVADARIEAQARLGIDPEFRSPITKAEALKLTTPLRTMLPGDEKRVLEELGGKFRQMFGNQADEAFSYALRAQRIDAEVAKQASGVLTKLRSGVPVTQAEAQSYDDAREDAAARGAVEARGAPGAGTRSGAFEPRRPGAAQDVIRRADNPESAMTMEPSTFGSKPSPTPKAIEDLQNGILPPNKFDTLFGTGMAKEIMEKYPAKRGGQ